MWRLTLKNLRANVTRLIATGVAVITGTAFVATGLPYALDETLATLETLEMFPNVAALVAKPTILGGVGRIRQLASHNKPIVFSACFESGIGIARIAQLAAEYAPKRVAGLDTYSYLSEDVLIDRLRVDNWLLAVPESVTSTGTASL